MHLVDATMFFCARSGGVKRYLLAKRAWLARHTPWIEHTLLVPVGSERLAGVQIADGARLPLPAGYRLPLSVADWRRRLISLAPDVIEAGDPYTPAWAARQAAHRLGVPAVAFHHSDMTRLLMTRVGRWTGPIARAYLRQLYDGFDCVFAPSRLMHHQLLDIGIQRVRLQPLGVDTDVFTPARADHRLRALLHVSPDTRLLVYAGRFAAEKNIPTLLSVAGRLGSGHHLVLIGGRGIERLASNVTVLPYQRNADRLARWLASCDLFIHAGDSETYGLVVLEAMACGLPVVAAPCAALPELVDDSVGRLAARASVDALVDAVLDVCSRDRNAIARSARERVVQRYSWDAVFPRLLNQYAGVSGRMPVRLPRTLPSGAES